MKVVLLLFLLSPFFSSYPLDQIQNQLVTQVIENRVLNLLKSKFQAKDTLEFLSAEKNLYIERKDYDAFLMNLHDTLDKIQNPKNLSEFDEIVIYKEENFEIIENSSGRKELSLSLLAWPEVLVQSLSSSYETEPLYRDFLTNKEKIRKKRFDNETLFRFDLVESARKLVCQCEYGTCDDRDFKNIFSDVDIKYGVVRTNFKKSEDDMYVYDSREIFLSNASISSLYIKTFFVGNGKVKTEIDIYGIDNILFKMRLNSDCSLDVLEIFEYDENGNLKERKALNSQAAVLLRTSPTIRSIQEIEEDCLFYFNPYRDLMGTASDVEDVLVTMLDMGVDYNHPGLARHFKRDNYEGLKYLSEDSGPHYSVDASIFLDEPAANHGNHVAGLIARDNPHVQLLPIRSTQESAIFSLEEEISFAYARGSRITNLSVSSRDESDFTFIRRAIEKYPDMLFIVAAGNDGENLDTIPFYPANYHGPNVIVVASVNDFDEISLFSNYSPTKIDIAARGEGVYSFGDQRDEISLSGTSMSTPQITNLAAKIKAINPNLSPPEIIALIVANSTMHDHLLPYIRGGRVINAEKALEAAKESLRSDPNEKLESGHVRMIIR